MDWPAVLGALEGAALWVWAVVSSDIAQRVYVVIVALWAIVASALRARRTLEELQRGPPDLTIPGPRPQKLRTLRRRLAKYNAIANDATRAVLAMTAVVVFFGYIMPTFLLLAGAFWYDWLSFGRLAFVDKHQAPVAHPTVLQTVLFSATQLSKGALADLMDVLEIDWGSLKLDKSNYLAMGLVFGYRTFVGAWSVVFLVALRRLADVRGHIAERIKEVTEAIAKVQAGAARA